MTRQPQTRKTLWLPSHTAAQRQSAIEQAANLLRAGGVVAFPTETVYGLGADATSQGAVEGIFEAKQRPHSDPLIVHIADDTRLPWVTEHVSAQTRQFGERFWPGPLTLIVPRSAAIPALVSAGGDTVGVRVPRHDIALALIRAVGRPLAAPSANRFMHTSPTAAQHVLADLDGRIDAILDGGPCAIGVESTVLDLTSDPPRVLRPGGVTLEELRTIDPRVLGPEESLGQSERLPSASPGQMERHYAPRTPLVVFEAQGAAALAAVTSEARALLAQGKRVGALMPDDEAASLASMGVMVETLGPSHDLDTISRKLYAAMRRLDERELDVILAHTFDSAGMGLALRDRLRRAAGGRFRRADEHA